MELLHTLAGHSEKVLALAFSAPNAHVASPRYDGPIKLWDLATGEVLRTFESQADNAASTWDSRPMAPRWLPADWAAR